MPSYEVSSILRQRHWRKDWQRKLRVNHQVLPRGDKPGAFVARLLVRPEGEKVNGNILNAWRRMVSAPEVDTLQVFIEEYGAEEQGSSPSTALSSVPTFLPAELRSTFSTDAFPGGTSLFLLPIGMAPELPTYPMWVRDVKRSLQVLAGEYGRIVPPTFEFVPTLNCLFRCDDCSYRAPKERLGVWAQNKIDRRFHMSLTLMQILLQRLKDAGVKNILFTGGGEPLLNEDTPQAMKEARYDLGLNAALYTNGAQLNYQLAKKIVAADPVFVRVSLNAGQSRVHKAHHSPVEEGPDYFVRTVQGIESLAVAKGSVGSNTILGVSFLVHPNNAEDAVLAAKVIASIAKRNGKGSVDYMRFTPSVNYFGTKQHPIGVFMQTVHKIEELAAPILEEAGVSPLIYYHRFEGIYEPRTYAKCLAHGWYGEIGPQGEMFHCCEKLLDPLFSLGPLLGSESLMDILHGERRREVLEQVVPEAILGGTQSPCPVVCKPHELNKIFAVVEQLREQGKIGLAQVWLEQAHKVIVANPQQYVPGPLDGYQS